MGELVRLGDVCELVMGQSPSSTSYNMDGNGLPFYQGNSDFGEICPTISIWCTNPKKKAEKGDILISVRAPIGAINIASEECCIGRGLAAIRPKTSNVSSDYLVHMLLANRKKLERMGTGSTFKAIGKKVLSEYLIPIYDKTEQIKIGQQFTAILKCMKIKQQQLDKLDQLIKSQFVEMFGDQKENPKNFQQVNLSDVSFVGSSRRVFKNDLINDGIPFLRGTEVGAYGSGTKPKPSLFISESHYNELVSYTGKPEPGDLLMPSICPDGQIWQVDTDEPFYFKDGRVLWVKPEREKIDSCFLRYALKNRFESDFASIASGTTFAELKIVVLKQLVIPLPPLPLQQKFATFVAKVGKSRFVARKSTELIIKNT